MRAIVKEHVEASAAGRKRVEKIEIVGVVGEELDARLLDFRPDLLHLFHGVDTVDGGIGEKVVPELHTASITDANLENVLGGFADRGEELLIHIEVAVARVLVCACVVHEGLEYGHGADVKRCVGV